MALIDTLLSRLREFWHGKKAAPQEPRQTAQERPKADDQKAASARKPARVWEQAELHLPPEHPLSRLWEGYAQEQGAPLPAPRLSFAPLLERLGPEEAKGGGDGSAVLTEGELAGELSRLEDLADRTAGGRLTELGWLREAAGSAPPAMDAEAHVYVSIHAMTAWLLAYPPTGGGRELDREMVDAALKRARVCFGVEEKLLSDLPGRTDRYFTLHLAAVGRMPGRGKDGKVIDLFSRERADALKEDKTDRMDFASLELFRNIREGDAICRLIPPVQGQDGESVLGEVLPGKQGQAALLPMGDNTQVSEDGSVLVASTGGHIEFDGENFRVEPVLDIEGNVDPSTGDITYEGSVHIHGDVCSGVSVKATGSVTVDGVVESCLVEAGGDLVVRKGVQGGGQGVLSARRSVFVTYVEGGRVYAKGNVEAESLISCQVYCDRDVIVRSGRGTVAGGEIRAGHDVRAKTVGTSSELSTFISLGGRPVEEFEQADLRQTVGELERRLEKLERQPKDPAKLQQISELQLQLTENRTKQRQLENEFKRLDREEAGWRRGYGRLRCDVLNAGVEISIGGAFLRVAHETQMCVTSVSKGQIALICCVQNNDRAAQ